MKKNISLLLIFILFGCSHPNPWKYEFEIPQEKQENLNVSLGVVKIRDSRPNYNINRQMLLAVLFMLPFAMDEYNHPEWKRGLPPTTPDFESSLQYYSTQPKYLVNYFPSDFDLSTDLTKIMAKELQQNSFFSKVNLFTKKDSDFVLVGDLRKFSYEQTYISYLGFIFLPFGIPMGRVHNDIVVNFKLINSKTYQTVFSKEYTQHQSKFYNNIYYNKRNLAPYDTFWKNIMKDLIADLNILKPKLEISYGKQKKKKIKATEYENY